MRDMGPTFLVDSLGGVAATVWQFNVWGGKFSGYEEDCRLAERLASAIDMNTYPAPIVTEGGALHVDGEGTLLVTETSVLNDNRNPGLDKAEAERIFKHWLGISHVVWLPGCTTETITDGHVDGFACFVRPGVALAEQPDPSAADAGEMRENLRALRLARDAKGRSLDIGLLHRPKEVESEIGSFCDCYVNFYLANGGVVMPRFGDAEADRIAAETVAKAFPDRRVAQISIDAIAAGGGGIHCSTQQQPFGGNV
jgi:agmatine deiminase